ncbi:tetratricopeptide repeat protein [Oceaniglobus roseus]|uniref:tetratricopeptide repeat protein n=1 Tax=Oceaniglobus roseus TaxID=1737570 RepID=UPI000C7EF358|nr:tetratricopeptide repeat protein [Kandeliimicrobium roseum]
MKALALSLLAAWPLAAAADCPPPPDQTAALAELFDAARAAPNEAQGRQVSNAMWALWATAPDARAQEMLDRGMRRRGESDFDAAIAAFDELVAYCPAYAEGYNQRAFVNFLRQDYGTALTDLERAIELSPTHVAALAGMALTLMGLGRNVAAQSVLRQALELNPWLPERGLLVEPPGQKL